MSFNLEKPVRVISGENSVLNNGELLKQFGGKCLIVCSGTAAEKSGALTDIKKVLSENGIGFSVFNGITENPRTADCFKAGGIAREINAGFIIGIGGGSALDAAKAVGVYAANCQISSPDLIYSLPVENKPLPVVLIGTTAGTGSEVTGVSVLTNGDGKKKSVKGENYYASLVFADSKYTFSLPFSVTVSTALDALCHAVESYLSNKADSVSKSYSEKAVSLLWGELSCLEKEKTLPDNEQRDKLYDASVFAGLAIEKTGCCFPHTVGYFLTEKHSVPHGKACAVFLPEYVKRALEFNRESAEKILSVMKTDFDSFEKTVMSLSGVKIDLDKNELEKYLHFWENAANFDNSPGGYTADEARKLIINLFG
ncbi:MAG: iron-containing alcohol dehydrogenase [Ruminococcaceae bacterium]|nr:iron-containing alcohol dehydrogenase [Oscillospiraceae bacterium]